MSPGRRRPHPPPSVGDLPARAGVGLDAESWYRASYGGVSMESTISSAHREQKAERELRDALGSSLNIHSVLDSAYPHLLSLVDADYGALGISSSGKPED